MGASLRGRKNGDLWEEGGGQVFYIEASWVMRRQTHKGKTNYSRKFTADIHMENAACKT